MNPNILIPIFTGLLHLFLGIYVFRLKPRQKTQSIFLVFNLLMFIWLFIQGFRILLPPEYRSYALNITFLPMAFSPFTLYVLCAKIGQPDKKIPAWAGILGASGLLYFTYACLFHKMAELKNPQYFVFEFNLNYHALVVFCSFWMLLAIYAVLRKMITYRGDFKVRLFLVLLGAILAMPITMVFVYFLPMLGVFKPYLSSVGLILASVLWAVAILHYDAFKIKAGVYAGVDVPYINRVASNGFLKLLEKLDPMRFVQRSSKEKTEITKQILIQDYNLAMNTGELSVEERAKILSKKFGKYFR
ncbi:LIC10906 family membrane protein [Leptospira kmetyi]|uniref:LIC10906 family membrane protein n=1 Tax=Leptospira kmetyi TaxID=408139 RepID=UPI003EB7C757